MYKYEYKHNINIYNANCMINELVASCIMYTSIDSRYKVLSTMDDGIKTFKTLDISLYWLVNRDPYNGLL